MKVRYVFLATIGATLVGTAATVGIVFVGEELSLASVLLSSFSTLTLFLVPALVVSTLPSWTFDTATPDGRVLIRRAGIIVGVIQALAVIGAAVAGVLQPGVALYLVLVVSVAMVFTVASVYFGWRMRTRTLEKAIGEKPWQAIPSEEVARKVRTIVVTFFAAVAISAGLGAALFSLIAGGRALEADSVAAILLFACSIGLISAGGAAAIVSFAYTQRLQPALGNDVALARRLRRIVIRGKDEPLNDDERRRAARWASIMAVYLPFQESSSALSILGILLIQVNTLMTTDDTGLRSLIIVAFFVIAVVSAVTTIMLLQQARRVRAFAAQHRDLLIADPQPIGSGSAEPVE